MKKSVYLYVHPIVPLLLLTTIAISSSIAINLLFSFVMFYAWNFIGTSISFLFSRGSSSTNHINFPIHKIALYSGLLIVMSLASTAIVGAFYIFVYLRITDLFFRPGVYQSSLFDSIFPAVLYFLLFLFFNLLYSQVFFGKENLKHPFTFSFLIGLILNPSWLVLITILLNPSVRLFD